MKIGVITNDKKDPAFEYTLQICEFLQRQGITVITNLYPLDAKFWIVLGGDGTMLRYSHIAAIHNIPLLGINLGNLGFLTDAEKPEGLAAIAKVLAGDYETEKRLMLVVNGHSAFDETNEADLLALNDVYVGTAGGLKTFSVYVNNLLLDEIRADGVIVATPTGSTAYNLSAGGPILVPDGEMMVITPVCPHSLGTRSVVIGATDTVRIVAHQASPVVIDGVKMGVVSENSGVIVNKSPYYATIIKTAPSHLHAVLRRKKIL